MPLEESHEQIAGVVTLQKPLQPLLSCRVTRVLKVVPCDLLCKPLSLLQGRSNNINLLPQGNHLEEMGNQCELLLLELKTMYV